MPTFHQRWHVSIRREYIFWWLGSTAGKTFNALAVDDDEQCNGYRQQARLVGKISLAWTAILVYDFRIITVDFQQFTLLYLPQDQVSQE